MLTLFTLEVQLYHKDCYKIGLDEEKQRLHRENDRTSIFFNFEMVHKPF